MLHYLTTDIVDPFMRFAHSVPCVVRVCDVDANYWFLVSHSRPELVDRLASMLNYFLDQLAGPKCLNLKVNQPEKYGFKPRSLLRKISSVYIHLAAHSTRTQELADAVARDGRSYRDAVFVKAAAVLRKDALLPEEEVKKFEAFAALARESAQRANEAEENLGEIPDEFLGTRPFFFALLTDRQHLLTSCVCRVVCVVCCGFFSRRSHFADIDDGSGHSPDVGQHHGPICHLAPPALHPVRSLQPQPAQPRHAPAQYAPLFFFLLLFLFCFIIYLSVFLFVRGGADVELKRQIDEFIRSKRKDPGAPAKDKMDE
jgi:hypothetical protein